MPHLNHQRGDTRQLENLGRRRCSCSSCGNPRRNGWDEPVTRQELRQLLDDQPEPRRGRAKYKPRRIAIEVRWIDRHGDPTTGWSLYHRRYRRERDARAAVVALNRVDRWRRWWRVREYRLATVRGR